MDGWKRYSCKHEECEAAFETEAELSAHIAHEYHCPQCGSPKGRDFDVSNSFALCSWCYVEVLDVASIKYLGRGRVNC